MSAWRSSFAPTTNVPKRWRVEALPHRELPLWVAVAHDDLGELLVAVGLDGEAGIQAHARRWHARLESGATTSQAAVQLREYLDGERENFNLRLLALGSEFEREAWVALTHIPFGETRSYGEQARAIGSPGAARAVGRANARNPIPIVVPCHRVIGSDGSLTGFAGGLDLKRWLLAHEGSLAAAGAGPRLAPRDQLALF